MGGSVGSGPRVRWCMQALRQLGERHRTLAGELELKSVPFSVWPISLRVFGSAAIS